MHRVSWIAAGLVVLGAACGSSKHYDVHCSGGFAAAAGEAPDDTASTSRAEADDRRVARVTRPG